MSRSGAGCDRVSSRPSPPVSDQGWAPIPEPLLAQVVVSFIADTIYKTKKTKISILFLTFSFKQTNKCNNNNKN